MNENDFIRDRYRLLRPLGAGGFGEVWLAKDQIIGTDCALKFYVRLDDKGREEFRKEYRRMLGIHDAHLLTASYYDEWQGHPFLVMDYCGGGAASNKVGQLSETELWRLIRDVSSGLVCLHSQRNKQGKEAPVIHQDIKPANFLQKGDGTWLISDFGISSRMRSSMSSQSGREVSSGGTIPYMGPERFGQDRMLVKASDIWALGASIYEMAAKDLPFDEYGGILQKKGEEIPHLSKGRWSSDLDRLVSSCLQKETWDRPTAALVKEYADCKLKGKPLPRLQALQSEPQKHINIADVVESVRRVKNQEKNKKETSRYYGSAGGHDYVDLGLPSGTLWATCNVGASNPEDYGDSYAWGETSTKSTYNWDTYKYANGNYYKLTKYCSESIFGSKAGKEGMLKFFGKGFTDNLTELQAGDDPATANWGNGWRTPTKAQWDELLQNTIHHWTTRNGKLGWLFTSKKNGQCVFLPRVGFRWGSALIASDDDSYYWSRSLNTDNPNFVWCLFFLSDVCKTSNSERFYGFSVRPIRQN